MSLPESRCILQFVLFLSFMTQMFFVYVLIAAVVNMAIGTVWYMPKVFGDVWQKEVGLKPKDMRPDTMLKAMGISFFSYLLVALTIGYVYLRFAMVFAQDLLTFTVILWLAFVLAIRLSHAAFEQKSWRYVAITAGHDLAGMLATAAILSFAL